MSTTEASPPAPSVGGGRAPRPRRPGLGLGSRMLVGMAVGALAGALLGERIGVIAPVGDLFIRLLVLAAVPLVFFNLLAGLTSLTDLKALGRLTGKILAWFVATTVLAAVLGIAVLSALAPGVGMTLTGEVGPDLGTAPSVGQVLMDLVPTNVVGAFVQGNVAQIVVISVLLGIATLLLPGEPRDRLRSLFLDLAHLLRKVVDIILVVAPWGIGALMAVTVGRYGAELFGPMAVFVVGVSVAHLLMVGLYMAVLALFTSRRPGAFLKETGALWATTAATTSSLASLSVGLELAEKMRLPRPIYAFTLPLGAQINKDGTAITLAAIVVFTAQAAGVTLTPGDLVTLVLLSFLFSAGSGGIPGGGFVVSLILVEAFSMPLELAAIVGGIYRLVDMGATTVNIMGDMVGTVLVSEGEGATLAAADLPSPPPV